MKHNSRAETIEKIKLFFEKDELEAPEVKKIKTLAMTHRIRLGEYRKRFCKKCYSDLKNADIRINKKYKQLTCKKCNVINRGIIKKIKIS